MNDLYHYGMTRRSGRYPWGSGDRPYQSGGGPSKKPPINETSEQRAQRKEKALKTARSASEIREFAEELTYNELDNALKRIDLNRKLDAAVKAEKEAGYRKIDEAMNKVADFNRWTQVGVIEIMNNTNAVVDLINSINSAKKGEYSKYKQYMQDRQKQSQSEKTNKGK